MKTVHVMYFTLTKWSLNKNFFFAAILSVLCSLSTEGQILQTERFELPVNSWEQDYTIVSAGYDGLFLHRQVNQFRNDYVHLIKLDTAFKEDWSGFLQIDRGYEIASKKTFNNSLYLLLNYFEYRKNDLILFIIDNKEGNYEKHYIKSYIPFIPTEFETTKDAVLIGGYFNNIPFVLYYNYHTRQSKVLPGLFNEAGELTQIKTNPDNTFDVLISAKNFSRQKTIWIKTYDHDGTLLRNLPLQTESSRHLVFGRSLETATGNHVVAGVFGNRVKEFTKGIFITQITPAGEQTSQYYNFVDMQNFFKYMKAKREQRVKDRIARKKVKGKKVRMSYRFLVHELIPYKDNYILLGEAFYPKYQNSTSGTSFGGYAPYYPGYTSGGRMFAGFHYTHAVVICFDKQGKMLWDNSFEINDVKTFKLEQFVKMEIEEDKIAMLYMYEGAIRSKIIKDNQVVEGKNSDPIKTLRDADVVKENKSSKGKLEYWYNDFLYASGVQEIINHGTTGYGKRKVFFINKLSVGK